MFFEAPRVTNDTWHLFEWLTLSLVSNAEQIKQEPKWGLCGTCVTTLEDGNPKVWING